MERAPITEKLLRRIAECVPAIVALYSPKTGEYLYVSPASTRILGYTPKEIMEGGLKLMTAAVHPEDLQRVMQENAQAIERANKQRGGDELVASFKYRMRRKDGEWRWLHTDGTIFEHDEQGKVSLLLNVSLDITAQKLTEMQLKRSLAALENALNA